MEKPIPARFTAFANQRRIATGHLPEVAALVRHTQLDQPEATLLVFDDTTGRVVDLDLRGTPEEVRARVAQDHRPAAAPEDEPSPESVRRPGRPKLGVVAREVTLLPRHWDWLAQQPGGVSVTLRKLVEAARKGDSASAQSRRIRDATYRFMQTMAGDEPGFEEASRALFAGDSQAFETRIAAWPADIRAHLLHLAGSHTADLPPDPASR